MKILCVIISNILLSQSWWELFCCNYCWINIVLFPFCVRTWVHSTKSLMILIQLLSGFLFADLLGFLWILPLFWRCLLLISCNLFSNKNLFKARFLFFVLLVSARTSLMLLKHFHLRRFPLIQVACSGLLAVLKLLRSDKMCISVFKIFLK